MWRIPCYFDGPGMNSCTSCTLLVFYFLFSSYLRCCCVFFLQRGTGLSTPLTPSSMSQLGSAEEIAEYLKYFRADNIVNDAEFIRVRLVPEAGPWTVLGQVWRILVCIVFLFLFLWTWSSFVVPFCFTGTILISIFLLLSYSIYKPKWLELLTSCSF